MPEAGRCPKCGATLLAETDTVFCPACAMRAAFEAEGHDPERGGPATEPSGVVTGDQDLEQPGKPEIAAGAAARAPKTRRFGDYELLEEIARGGMGVVYRARQVSLNRIVAVKTILAGQLASAADMERFRAEARAAASLQHPNIVAIHEVGEQDGQQCFSMDYIKGRNLAEVVREGPLPARQAARYLQTIAEAIHFAHQRGILHRDLKPSNVLLDLFDQPRVTDFGLAKQMKADSDLTRSGQVLGSPNFMPPEQAASKHGQVGPPSDVYSLGAILYYLLAGRPPFAAETLANTLQQVCQSEPAPLRLWNPSVQRDLETMCLKCLEKEPRRRYATAQELAEELGRFLSDEPILARPVSQPEKLWRWCRRKPALAALAASVVALLASIIVLSLVAAGRATAARDAEKRERQIAERARTNEMQLRLAAETAEKSARTEAVNSVAVANFLREALRGVRPSIAKGRDPTLLREILDRTAQRVGRELTNQPEVEANLRFTLGQVYRDLGDHAKSEEMSRAELAIWRKLRPEVDGKVAYSLNNVALELAEQGKLDEAEQLQRQALAIHQKLYSEPHSETVNSLGNLGLTLLRRGQLADAEEFMRQAADMGRKLQRDKRLDGPAALANLASLLSRTGKLADAEELDREALARRRERWGEEHVDVAHSLNNLGLVLSRQRKFAEAETMWRQALAIRRKLLDPTHEKVATTLENLAGMLRVQNRPAEAEPLYRDLLQNFRARLPADSEEILRTTENLGCVLAARGWAERSGTNAAAAAAKAREAVQLLRDSLARRREAMRPSSTRRANTTSRLAGALIALAATDSALTTEERVALLVEAEPLLTTAYETILPRAKNGAERDEVERFIQLYETWETLWPGAGKAALAVDWKQKLEALPPLDASGVPPSVAP
jgi:tetratricopeptide (TPR) repeat protein/tRNA A-37 threonylcarbamoyl transferase component Bud32